MKHLKITKFLLVIAALTFGLSQTAYTQQSDYQIKQNFDQDLENIYQGLLEVETSEEAEELRNAVNELQDKYSEYEEFLNVLIYPETFEDRINYLGDITESTQRHLVRIETGTERGDELDELVAQMSDSLTESRQQIEQLSQDLAQTRRARDASAGQVQTLRAQLRDRDAFILNLADSLFVAYDDLDLQSLSPGERRDIALEIDADNIFGHLESVVQNNLAFLDTHTQLSSEDFLRLYATYYTFNEVYENLGPQLAEIYVGQAQRQERIEQISQLLEQWGNQAEDAVWQSLYASFQERNIELQPFEDGMSFYTSLNNYLDQAIARAQEEGGEEELQRYESFVNVWQDDVKRRWQQHLIDADLMTYENFATIDSKVNTWNLVSQPTSYTMFIVLGIAVLVIIGLLLLWLKAKTSGQSGTGQPAAPRPARPRAPSQPMPSRPVTPAPRQSAKPSKKLNFPKPDDDPEAKAQREARRSKRRY
ncbi:MAG: hypothetical protein WD267_02540 [Balneolales bacterium]